MALEDVYNMDVDSFIIIVITILRPSKQDTITLSTREKIVGAKYRRTVSLLLLL